MIVAFVSTLVHSMRDTDLFGLVRYVLGPNIQYFAAHGVRGIFEEGSYGTSGGERIRQLRSRPVLASLYELV